MYFSPFFFLTLFFLVVFFIEKAAHFRMHCNFRNQLTNLIGLVSIFSLMQPKFSRLKLSHYVNVGWHGVTWRIKAAAVTIKSTKSNR